MTQEFGDSYAGQYDSLYGDKDYRAECDAVEMLIRRHAQGEVRAVLDLGCGTGTHAFILADRGYRVTGVDRSPAMLAHARAKAAARPASGGLNPDFLEGDVRDVRTGGTYDAVLMLFAVLGYQTTNADVAAALRTAQEHLRPGGVFICDIWFGPAVLAEKPTSRTKVVNEGDTVLTRTATGTLDVMHHACRVDYQTRRTRAGSVVEQAEESHTMRYFFPLELDSMFSAAALRLRAIHPFDRLDSTPDIGSWNVWVCASR